MNKERLKQLLYGVELRSTAIIVNGLVHRVPKRMILKQIREELLVSGKRIGADLTELYESLVHRYIKVSRATFSRLRKTDLDYKDKLVERQNVVYEVIRKSVQTEMEYDKNWLANEIEYRKKTIEIGKLTRDSIFVLCSSHEKPARDHEEWEGKVYVCETWKDRVSDPEVVARIEEYIKENDVRTVEWVTGPPVYLITRPNCKHYLIPVPIDDVLENRLSETRKLHIMKEIPQSYEKSIYKGYYERLKALVYFKKMCPSEELNKDIKKTRQLTVRWAARMHKK